MAHGWDRFIPIRTTPIDSALPSPVELLNSRKYQDNLQSKIRNSNYDSSRSLHQKVDACSYPKCLPEPRSYVAQMPDGPTLCRNRAHIRDVEPKKKISFAGPPVTGGSPPTRQSTNAQVDTVWDQQPV